MAKILTIHDELQLRRDHALSSDEKHGIDRVVYDLDMSRLVDGPFAPRGSMQSWRETLYVTIADGAQILNTTTETILIPDFTLPANYMYPGRSLKYTLFGDSSFIITSPSTLTLRQRWGGVAGTVMAASGGFTPDPTAAQTTRSWSLEFYTICRSVGSSGTSYTMGRWILNDYDDTSAATIVGNLNMSVIPTNAPATATINTTTANALSATAQHGTATATTQTTCHMAILESLS